MNSNKGFTLIELLVVVLIIGILAAIAVPQYQKAVYRSKAKSMLLNLKSLHEAMQSYYLANNVYPVKLSDLDITFNGYTKSCIYAGSLYTNASCKANDYSNLFINVVSGVGYHPSVYFNNGPYKSGGFYIHINTGNIICYEHGSYISQKGDFCEKVMGCQENGSSGADFRFTCPDL